VRTQADVLIAKLKLDRVLFAEQIILTVPECGRSNGFIDANGL
jgi:hypothetical protein